MTVLRIVGNNRKGGARKYCYLLNAHLEARGQGTLTFIPRAPAPDDLSDAETVPFAYRHYRSDAAWLWHILRRRRDHRYAHLHLRNVIMLAAPLLRAVGLPYVVTCHAAIGTPVGLRGRLQARSYLRALSGAKAVVFISAFVRDDTFAKLGIAGLPVPHAVIHNGSERPAGPPVRVGGDPGRLRIVVVGELTARKQIDVYPALVARLRALRAATGGPEIAITFFGRGPLEPVVRAMAAEQGQGVTVRHAGYVETLDEVFGAADLHLILARDEAFGRVVTEAMAYGVPTMALRAGAFPELVTDGVDGVIVDSPEAAAERIAALDGGDLAAWGAAALRTFEARFTIDASCAATVAFVEGALAGGAEG
jgi:glycosyltransferase involved in cell wall biosynthesis